MKTAIKKIYYGESSIKFMETTAEYKRLSSKSLKIYDALREQLTKEQKQMLEDLLEFDGLSHDIMVHEYYKAGFKMGLSLGVEVFEPQNKY